MNREPAATGDKTLALDYFGVRPECGCLTAWMAGDRYSTPAEVRRFYREMANTGREVRRLPLTDENRAKLGTCPHGRMPDVS